MPTKLLTAPTPPIHGPADPARVTPLHLPALAHVASDLDPLDAPVKVVNREALDYCEDCAAGDDVPDLGAIATAVAYDPHGFGYRTDVCALHLPGVVQHYRRHGWPTVVAVPTSSRRWFERTDRETYWALDEYAGIAVTRTTLDVWAVWEVADTVPFGPPLCLHPDRGVAEVLAQAYAAQWAADAYELATVVAELHPPRVLGEVA